MCCDARDGNVETIREAKDQQSHELLLVDAKQQHTVSAQQLAAMLPAEELLLTPQPRVVVSGADAFYSDPLPAERGQHQPLSEEIASFVLESVACHVFWSQKHVRGVSTCVWFLRAGRRWWWWWWRVRSGRRVKGEGRCTRSVSDHR